MAKVFHVDSDTWKAGVKALVRTYAVYGPIESTFGIKYSLLDDNNVDKLVYLGARIYPSIKFFLYPVQENVVEEIQPRDTILMGVKGCDLRAVATLDSVFLDPDFIDDYYKLRRDNTIIISEDCFKPLDVCFCSCLGDTPFPEKGFDLNLSYLEDKVLIEVGTERGQKVLDEMDIELNEADATQIAERDELRKRVAETILESNKKFNFSEDIYNLLKNNYESEVWKQHAETCVSCFACTNVCPSCHCFLLQELKDFAKARVWDSCQSVGYARVAGGANPRKHLFERFRNRYYCKFVYRVERFGLRACVGCGRCIEACHGKIDMREVLTDLAK